MTTFKELGLSENFLKTIESLKYTEPTEIQEKTIPLTLEGKDVMAESATGSGKTLAFGARIIELLEKERGKGVRALALTPTRELAEQVGKEIRKFAKHTSLKVAIVYGGVGLGPQVQEIERADIVVGTPGRILDHLERGSLKLKNVRILVLDEADRMLDMGFIDDVTRIINVCPDYRQTMLFSATLTGDIKHIAKHYMQEPVEVSTQSHVDPSKLVQFFYDVPRNNKFSLLVHLLKGEQAGLVMVFCNTRHVVDFVERHLREYDIEAVAIHGGLSQAKRSKIMENFRANRVFVLVCTDVAARGLDVKGVSHVYNYDIPKNSKEYVHRIGRTARAGKDGKAVSLVSDRDYDSFRMVLRDPAIKITNIELPKLEELRVRFDRLARHPGRDASHYGDRNMRGGYGGRGGGDNRGGRRDNRGERRYGRGRERYSGYRR